MEGRAMRHVPRFGLPPLRLSRGLRARSKTILPVLLWMGLPLRASAAPLMAAPFSWYDSGFSARAVAVGDLNHDGFDDVAVADGFGTVGGLLWGRGGGGGGGGGGG